MNGGDQLQKLEDMLLIRESLTDTGYKLHTNASPYIVVQYSPLSDPLYALTKTYNEDVSENKVSGRTMYVYVRFKNTGNMPLGNFYIHVYRNHLGLYNNPKEWNKYKLATIDGKPSKIERLNANTIGVSKAFVFDNSEGGMFPNCLIAVATYEEKPDFSYINTYEKYIKFIDQKNVAARNVYEISGKTSHEEQQIFCPITEPQPRNYYFIAEIQEGTASNTKYGIWCSDPPFSGQTTYIKADENTRFLIKKVRLSGRASGYWLTLWEEVPSGGHAEIRLRILIEASNDELMQYAEDMGDMLKQNDIEPEFVSHLVALGDCTIKMDRRR